MIVRASFAIALMLCSPATASLYCSEPSAPWCAERFGAFDDEYDFDRCKREIESYKYDVERYTDCVADEARREIDEAIDNYNSAVESFNRRARGW